MLRSQDCERGTTHSRGKRGKLEDGNIADAAQSLDAGSVAW